jgi:hypothetical protein
MHRTTERFWRYYRSVPEEFRQVADKSFELLKSDPRHPSLHLKRVGKMWSARIGHSHRALAVEEGADFIWVWIGSHDDYKQIIKRH